jgi:hypothetical protein
MKSSTTLEGATRTQERAMQVQVHTLCLTDVVDSTRLAAALGEARNGTPRA